MICRSRALVGKAYGCHTAAHGPKACSVIRTPDAGQVPQRDRLGKDLMCSCNPATSSCSQPGPGRSGGRLCARLLGGCSIKAAILHAKAPQLRLPTAGQVVCSTCRLLPQDPLSPSSRRASAGSTWQAATSGTVGMLDCVPVSPRPAVPHLCRGRPVALQLQVTLRMELLQLLDQQLIGSRAAFSHHLHDGNNEGRK